jgi:hypothetical protein
MNTSASPSGKYTLTVTSEDHWQSKGVVRRISDGAVVGTIERNYASFPACWIEGHPNGHDYLIGGEDYQGQTVIELDTGKRRDFLPPEAEKGHGFCWAEARFDAAARVVVAEGCFWAAPYEFRFYDFANPMAGWPELTMGDDYVDDDARWPDVATDGTIRAFQSAEVEEADDVSADAPDAPGEVVAIKTFKREGLTLKLIGEWVSNAEQAKRAASEIARAKHEADLAEFRKSDPLYLTFRRLADALEPNKDHYDSYGVTFDGWCPHLALKERRWCRRIYGAQRDADGVLRSEKATTIDLEWATKTGPIKVDVYKGGRDRKAVATWFEHSVDGMEKAFAFAKREAKP